MPDKMSAREDRPPARLRRRGRRRADRRRRRTRRESYYRVADRLAEEIPGAFQPNQYFNPANPAAHYASTGPRDVGADRRRDHAPRRRRRHRRHDHRHGALPQGAQPGDPGRSAPTRPARSTPRRTSEVQAATSSRASARTSGPTTFDPSVVDRYVTVSDKDAFLTTRRLATTEGILAGGSGGLAVHAALEVAQEIDDPEAHRRRDPARRRAHLPRRRSTTTPG